MHSGFWGLAAGASNMMKKIVALVGLSNLLAIMLAQATPVRAAGQGLPAKFDLRDIGALTPIKQQQGGTCWTHGAMAAIESNLLISGTWKKLGRTDVPKLSEYHLDW